MSIYCLCEMPLCHDLNSLCRCALDCAEKYHILLSAQLLKRTCCRMSSLAAGITMG